MGKDLMLETVKFQKKVAWQMLSHEMFSIKDKELVIGEDVLYYLGELQRKCGKTVLSMSDNKKVFTLSERLDVYVFVSNAFLTTTLAEKLLLHIEGKSKDFIEQIENLKYSDDELKLFSEIVMRLFSTTDKNDIKMLYTAYEAGAKGIAAMMEEINEKANNAE